LFRGFSLFRCLGTASTTRVGSRGKKGKKCREACVTSIRHWGLASFLTENHERAGAKSLRMRGKEKGRGESSENDTRNWMVELRPGSTFTLTTHAIKKKRAGLFTSLRSQLLPYKKPPERRGAREGQERGDKKAKNHNNKRRGGRDLAHFHSINSRHERFWASFGYGERIVKL